MDPELQQKLEKTDFVLFFIMVAGLVGRHSMARRSLGRSPMATSECEFFFFNKFSLTGSSDSLVSDGECILISSSHAHFSQSCQSLWRSAHLFSNAHSLAQGPHGLKCQDESFCAHSLKHYIHTPCHSWVFQAFLPSFRHIHRPGHLVQRHWNQTKPVRDSATGWTV